MVRQFSETDRAGLIAALRMFEGADSDWDDHDLADMYQQQLDAPLAEELRETLGVIIETAMADGATGPPLFCLRDLLWHPSPPAGLLGLAKDFAKVSADHPDRPLPRSLARVLYYATIVVACRHGFHITQLDPPSFRAGLEWGVQQTWIDDATRLLLQSGL